MRGHARHAHRMSKRAAARSYYGTGDTTALGITSLATLGPQSSHCTSYSTQVRYRHMGQVVSGLGLGPGQLVLFYGLACVHYAITTVLLLSCQYVLRRRVCGSERHSWD